jgi:hypothetical protein
VKRLFEIVLAINQTAIMVLGMNSNTAAKVKTLFNAIAANYRARGDAYPEVAAKFQLELALQVALSQPKFTDQLLDEEIEDTLKAGMAL